MASVDNKLLHVAVVQLTSNDNVKDNLERAAYFVEQAARFGATFIALPENFGFLGAEGDVLKYAQPLEGLFTQTLRRLAQRYGIFILAGSIPEKVSAQQIYNTSVLIGTQGETLAFYRKIHLFDVALGDKVLLQESKHVLKGKELVVASLADWQVGLSICYDLRFAELYRTLVKKGADILTVPAAFTLHTGKDHWEVLLRARAIENQCYVLAPAQVGRHSAKRDSWGKAMIIDPWGTPLAIAPERECFISAQLDKEFLLQVRRELPCLGHCQLP